MTGVTGKGGGLFVASAGLEELQLHAVYIGFAGAAEIEIIIGQCVARNEIEDRLQLNGITGVADTAHIELLLSGECFYCGYEFGLFDLGMLLLKFDMLCGGAVAAFAVDAIYNR